MEFLKKGKGGKFLFLAPMAGYTNGACRKIFREYGADGVVSEFVYSRAVLCGGGRILERMRFDESERPVGIQIFGSDPSEMAEAALAIEEKLSPDFIDVNFGCPAPNAVCAGAGSALLRDVPKMGLIIKKMSSEIRKTPITAKMRIGWDSSSIVVPDAAKLLEASGAQMITLHGRTKAQGYEGEANWDLIEEAAKTVKVPLIGNGSVERRDGSSLAASACAGFMIGRAALGNPWIFNKIRAAFENLSASAEEPSARDRARLALRYAELVSGGGYSGIDSENLTHAKTQIMRFLKNAEGFKKLRVGLKNIATLDELKVLLCEYV